MNVIFKVIRDILHLQDRAEEEKRRQAAQDPGQDEPRRCPVCQEPAGEHDTECPSCGARLD